MGCHTWFYVPTDTTFDEAQKVAIEYLEECCFRWGEGRDSLARSAKAHGWTNEFLDETLVEFQDLLALAKSGNRNTIIIWCNEKNGTDYSKKTDKWYKDHQEYHDLFRVGDYPDDELFSLQDCINFISKNSIKRVYWGGLRKFWKDNPKGRITFG